MKTRLGRLLKDNRVGAGFVLKMKVIWNVEVVSLLYRPLGILTKPAPTDAYFPNNLPSCVKILIILLPAILFLLGCDQGGKLLTIGDKAPDFSISDMNGNQVTLSDFLKDNKEVILAFWTTWCPECRKEMPILNEFAKKHRDKVEIVGINLKESKEVVKSFVEPRGIGFKILLDTKGKVARLYNVYSIPTSVLINKEGLIKSMNLDVRQMESYLS